uniref:Uncharacterized protein n=1 Tax=Panagrolaimus sp. PS1159 TaxID=55785 RepID=A0AC35FWZ8_9BILA
MSSTSNKINNEEKVRKVLRELREKNINLENDIMKLEEVLQLPTFSQITGKLYSLSPRQSIIMNEQEITKKIERCRQLLEPKLNNHLRDKQKLIFVAADLTKCHPKVILHNYDTSTKTVDSNGNRLSTIPFPAFIVVGPKDIAKR